MLNQLKNWCLEARASFLWSNFIDRKQKLVWWPLSFVAMGNMFSRPLIPKQAHSDTYWWVFQAFCSTVSIRAKSSHLLSPCVSLQLSARVCRTSCQGWSPFLSHEPVCPRARTWRLHAHSAPTHAESALTLWTGPSEPSGPPAEPSGVVSSAVGAWGCQQRRSSSHRSGPAASDGTPGGRVSPRPDLCCAQHPFLGCSDAALKAATLPSSVQ